MVPDPLVGTGDSEESVHSSKRAPCYSAETEDPGTPWYSALGNGSTPCVWEVPKGQSLENASRRYLDVDWIWLESIRRIVDPGPFRKFIGLRVIPGVVKTGPHQPVISHVGSLRAKTYAPMTS